MMRSSARLIELCLTAALGVAVASTPAPANPAPGQRDFSYAYVASGGSITMSGDAKDVARARRFQQGSGPLLWFRDGGQDYIVRDPDTLAQLDAVWKPGRELDRAEDKLDRQHDDLDARHDKLEAKRDALSDRRDALADRDAELADRASEDSLGASARDELARKRRELRQQRDKLEGEIHALEQPMAELRAQIDGLQRQLDALHAKQQAASAREDTEMRALLRRAITAGTAKPVR